MRPHLTLSLSAEEFEDWYWKKQELVDFCRQYSLPSSGNKPEIESRIKTYLSGLPLPPVSKPRKKGKMPTEFTLQTKIGKGWSCNPQLGKFFKQHCGNSFRFNHAMRSFIHHQEGKTLAEAIQCYQDSIAPDSPPQPSLPQNELVAFMKQYSKTNPNCSRQEMMEAWDQWKNQKRSSHL